MLTDEPAQVVTKKKNFLLTLSRRLLGISRYCSACFPIVRCRLIIALLFSLSLKNAPEIKE